MSFDAAAPAFIAGFFGFAMTSAPPAEPEPRRSRSAVL
jgi:hypothetical protein